MVPEINEQNKIVKFLENVDKKITKTSYELDKIKDFKKSLLQHVYLAYCKAYKEL